jgi:protein TonB
VLVKKSFPILSLPGRAIAALGALLAGCSSAPPRAGDAPPASAVARIERVETTADATSTARTVDAYKRDIALRISEVNSTKVFNGQPQALLRAVIVLKFYVDAGGKLLRSEIVRTNHDGAAEATALASLRNTAPFPKPAAGLLRNGRVELSETWLFNNDGRFQIRSVAQEQKSE